MDAWLRAEQFGKAFDLALTRSDLPLVMYICKQINPEELFDQQPPPVSQAILLSLVHHLAADFNEDLDLKLKWVCTFLTVHILYSMCVCVCTSIEILTFTHLCVL